MSMIIYLLEREGRYYSPMGWVRSLETAAKWHGEEDARVALQQMIRDMPAIVEGAQVLGKTVEGTFERPREAETAYNPWGLR